MNMMSKQASEYYADIMSDDTETNGMSGCVCGGTRASAVSKSTAFFANKREGPKEQVIPLEGMTSAIIHTVGVRSRGIRPWEKARYEAKEQRLREMERRQQQRCAARVRRQPATRVPPTENVCPAPSTPYTMPMPVSSSSSTTSSTASLAASVASTVLDAWDD